jgi:hypothetical protein
MKINSFFKILNRKINKYDKIATNPFCRDKKMIIIWVEESNEPKSKADNGDEIY